MISLYLDSFINVDEIINAYKTLNVKRFPLRDIEGINIYNLEEENYNEIKDIFNKEKVRFSLIDIDVEYDLYKGLDLEKLASISKDFSCREMVINLPTFSNFEAEKDELIKVVKGLIVDLKKLRINPTFHVNYEINSAYIAFLVKEIDGLNFLFNPGKCYLNDKSITTYYRLLRRIINYVVLYDLDENKSPTLLGYGKALILDMIDKLNIDKFRGDIYYDFNLTDYVKDRNTNKKAGFFSRFFGRKKEKAHQKIDKRLKVDDDTEVDIISLLDSQLQLIKKYQKS